MDILRGLGNWALTTTGAVDDTKLKPIRDKADEWDTYGRIMFLAAAFFVLLAIVTGNAAWFLPAAVIGYLGYEVTVIANNVKNYAQPVTIAAMTTKPTDRELGMRLTQDAPIARWILLSALPN